MGGWTLVTPLFQLWRISIIRGHPVLKSLQGDLSTRRGWSFEGHNLELVRAINELLNVQDSDTEA